MATTPEIPIIDFSAISGDTNSLSQETADQVTAAVIRYGFVKLINHGISDDEIGQLFKWNKQFFDLPEDQKLRIPHPAQPNPHRGYSRVGQETISLSQGAGKCDKDADAVLDLKEHFDFGSPSDTLFPSIWLPDADLPGFRPFMQSTYLNFQNLHTRILLALEQGLHLSPGTLTSVCDNGNSSEFRLTHYPSCSTDALTSRVKRIAEHTDFGTVTILFQDSVGGLEAEDQLNPGTFLPVRNDGRNEAIINVGDCLQRWTNGTIPSINHRVSAPPDQVGAKGSKVAERYSVAFFGKPARTQSVGPLPAFCKGEVAGKYEDISALEFNNRKILSTY